MANLIALCVEDLEASDPDLRFLRCVALQGHAPGLGFDDRGHVRWRDDASLGCEVLVTLDGRLALWRRVGAARVVVTRSRRSLDVPVEKPVILLHEDELSILGRRLRIHIHGAASTPMEPEYLVGTRPRRIAFRAAAAAVVVGASLAASSPGAAQQGSPPIEVRDQPPAPPLPPDAGAPIAIATDPDGDTGELGTNDGTGGEPGAGADEPQPIEVRDQPPVMVEPPPPAGCCTHQPGAAAATPWWRKKM